MSRFSYSVRDSDGKLVMAIAEAVSAQDLVSKLRQRNLTVISLKEIAKRKVKEKKKAKKIKLTAIAFFFRQLSTMLAAGIPLVDSLRELSRESENLSFSALVNKLREDIEKGENFSSSLASSPEYFPLFITAMVEAGEKGGNLSTVLSQISEYLEDRIALQREVKSATSYPLFIAGFFFLALCFIIFFLIPKFEGIFSTFKIELPLFTRIVMGVSNFFLHNLPYLIFALIVLITFAYRYARTRNGRRIFDKMKLNLPIVGKIFLMTSLSNFCRTFSALLTSGVSASESLATVGRVSGNMLIEEATEKVRLGVIGGSNISSEMREFLIFPPLLARMVAVGERTGKLGEMFSRVNDFYQDEVRSRVKVLTSVLEPVLLIGLGVIVGIVVIALYLPIFKMAGAARI